MNQEQPPNRDFVPGNSAHAYIDYLEGCLTEIRLRLENLEKAHVDLNIAFHRRVAEFEARLDQGDQSENERKGNFT